jgi:two-component system, OmpR family, sensor histidine kinase MprB
MSLRMRVALLVALVALVAMSLAGVGSWLVARNQLRAAVDRQLDDRFRLVPGVTVSGPGGRRQLLLFGLDDTVVQVNGPAGQMLQPSRVAELPVPEEVVEVANGRRDRYRYDTTVGSVHLRVLARPLGAGVVQLARPLTHVDESLDQLRSILVVAGLAATALAGVAGFAFARRSLRPVAELTAAAEHVAATQELDAAIPVDRRDELGRLAASFDQMLRALDHSRRQQQQLVDDASHELRTPLTSLRTNVEVLRRVERLDPVQRREIHDDILSELDQLTELVTELVDLAADPRGRRSDIEIDLEAVVTSVVERQRRRTAVPIEVTYDGGGTLSGDPVLVERAVSNLLDNAVKWSPPDGPIEVSLNGGRIAVRDHGPGIAPADREKVFDRFWRADEARTMPGSGLGLSIVRQVAQVHGGNAWAEEPQEGGGALLVLELPLR